MAELNPELPQTEAQGAVGGISPNLEAITAAGRGIETAGSDISQGGGFLYRKSAEEEKANVYADMAYAREKYTENLNNALITGQLDTEDFAQTMKDDTDKIGQNLSTVEGRTFFERQQARLQGAMLLKASHVSGQIAYNNTVETFNKGIDSDSNVANMDPNQFPDLIDKNEELIGSNSQLTPAQAERLRLEMHKRIADGAARGLAEQDPGKNDDGTPKENHLLQTLKGLDPADKEDPSNLYRYLNADQISGLKAYARHMDSARAIQEDQVLANQLKLQRLKGQVWLTQNKESILSGQMDPRQIIKNPNLTIEEAEMATRMVREHNKWNEERDPGYINGIEDKIINGQITSRDQLTQAYNENPTKMGSAYWQLAKRIDETPDGQVVKNSLRQLYQMGDQELKFRGLGGAYTAEGDNRNYAFRQEVQSAADAFVASQKGTLRDFYSNHNPKDPDSPLAVLNKYRMSATDKARLGAQEALSQANGQNPGTIQYSTSPTKDIPVPPPKAPPTKDMIQPGESIKDWKKRTGK